MGGTQFYIASQAPRNYVAGSRHITMTGSSVFSITMVAIAVVQAFRLAFARNAGEPSGFQGALTQDVRGRFNIDVAHNDEDRCAVVAHGMAPLIRYINLNILPLASLAPDKYAEALHDLLGVAATHTFILRRFDGSINPANSWMVVSSALAQMQEGIDPVAPTSARRSGAVSSEGLWWGAAA